MTYKLKKVHINVFNFNQACGRCVDGRGRGSNLAARPRSWHIRVWRGNPNSYRDILGVSELVFSRPTTLLEEAWSNSKKLYNKNFKVEIHNFQIWR